MPLGGKQVSLVAVPRGDGNDLTEVSFGGDCDPHHQERCHRGREPEVKVPDPGEDSSKIAAAVDLPAKAGVYDNCYDLGEGRLDGGLQDALCRRGREGGRKEP